MNIREFRQRRQARKQLKELRSHAKTLYLMRHDIVAPDQAHALHAALDEARRQRRGSHEAVLAATRRLETLLGEWQPLHRNGWTENFEVLLVALGVAMAFRCYFFQPFKIPTGSMQPTLYGIHSEECAAPTALDRHPFKVAKWLVTGSWYREVRVSSGGKVYPLFNDDSKPGYVALQVASKRYFVPSDAVFNRSGALKLDAEGRVAAGGVLWSGVVHAGDHLFVNRILWNFRRPQRGEVMVFTTSGIPGLPPGTHYIKRMTGLPHETIAIRAPELLVNGEPVSEPYTIGRVVRREKLAEWAPAYAGYQTIGPQAPVDYEPALRSAADQITLGPDQYYALGDNTGNSRDSRYWGPVPERNLLGPAAIVYWPFTSPRRGVIH